MSLYNVRCTNSPNETSACSSEQVQFLSQLRLTGHSINLAAVTALYAIPWTLSHIKPSEFLKSGGFVAAKGVFPLVRQRTDRDSVSVLAASMLSWHCLPVVPSSIRPGSQTLPPHPESTRTNARSGFAPIWSRSQPPAVKYAYKTHDISKSSRFYVDVTLCHTIHFHTIFVYTVN